VLTIAAVRARLEAAKLRVERIDESEDLTEALAWLRRKPEGHGG
jgi:hypothetical protein